MNKAAHNLQKTLFQAIEADAALLRAFALYGPGASMPQFSYDGMTSSWRDRPARLSIHRIDLSVWTPQAALADGAILVEAITGLMEGLEMVTPWHIFRRQLVALETGPDSTTQQWRQHISYDILLREAGQ